MRWRKGLLITDRNGVLAKRLNRLGRWCGGKVTVHVSFADVLFKLKTRVGSKSGFSDFLAFRYDYLKEVSHVLIHLIVYLCALLRRT